MKRLKNSLILFGTILLLMPNTGAAQMTESTDSLNTKLITAAREIMSSARTCTLITSDQESRARVR